VISPLLANVYLHYVFDLWAQRWRRHAATGDMIVVRYADDIIVGFEHETDARRFRTRCVCGRRSFRCRSIRGRPPVRVSAVMRRRGASSAGSANRDLQLPGLSGAPSPGLVHVVVRSRWRRPGRPQVSRDRPAGGDGGRELRILPSAPCLGALLIADPTGTLADCVFHREARLEPECNARRDDNLYDRHNDLLKAAAEKEEAIERALARV
jgi:hypothetical protein